MQWYYGIICKQVVSVNNKHNIKSYISLLFSAKATSGNETNVNMAQVSIWDNCQMKVVSIRQVTLEKVSIFKFNHIQGMTCNGIMGLCRQMLYSKL